MKKSDVVSMLRVLGASTFAERTGVAGSFCVRSGLLHQGESICLRDRAGRKRPAQFQPLAYWPDGTIKWMGTALVAPASRPLADECLRVTRGSPAHVRRKIRVTERKGAIHVNTGVLRCRIPRRGRGMIDRVSLCTKGRWIAKVSEKAPVVLFAGKSRSTESGNKHIVTTERFTGETQAVRVEQHGPIRAVVRIQGTHRSGRRTFLPFIVRLYFHAGCNTIRVVHTFHYDGDSEKDFIGELGIEFPVMMRNPAHDRHVVMGLDNGLWREPVQAVPAITPDHGVNPDYRRQHAFQYLGAAQGAGVTPVWHEYRLRQDSCDHYVIEKATAPDRGPVIACHGRRARGWGGILAPTGGVAVGMKDFWQAYPSAITVRNAGAHNDPVALSAALWPKTAMPLDLRHYDRTAYQANYESVWNPENDNGFWTKAPLGPVTGNAYGIGRTSEMVFRLLDGSEREDVLGCQAETTSNPPVLVCPPEVYEAAGVFSPWRLPSRKKALQPLERGLEKITDRFAGETERYRWYGFMDYGDFQMTYDLARRNWRYDVGGYAWMNEEHMPGIFLWQAFLRTGRLDVFRRAEAMSRHAEVDMFHIGPLAGIGTRHNVKHWGCGNHEIRQSQAGNKRYHHLITGDERSREIILDECPRVGKAWVAIQKTLWGKRDLADNEVRGTLGPHLSSFFWNWLAYWELTGSAKHRDMIVNGVKYLIGLKQPYGLAGTGMTYRINFETGSLALLPHMDGKPPMVNQFGAIEIFRELSALLHLKAWDEALCRYGEVHLHKDYERRWFKSKHSTGKTFGRRSPATELIAFAGAAKNDRKMMLRAVTDLARPVKAMLSRKVQHEKTNCTLAYWGTRAIAVIAILEDSL